jgi:hypothetical protein
METAWFCDACGKLKYQHQDLLKCGKCRQAFYHDQTCQKNHWPRHKAHCKKPTTTSTTTTTTQASSSLSLPPKEEPLLSPAKLAFQVMDTADKGRCAVALCDLQPGDVLLLERPALILDTRLEYVGLFQAFGKASHEMQRAILQLQAPPVPMQQQRRERLEQQRLVYCQRYPDDGITTEISQQLWAILECNGVSLFNYYDSSNHNNNDKDPKQWMGLFRQGSMLEHSCNPNVTMNTTREGYLELIAERTVAQGERLSFSYIEGIFEKTREQRQACLWQEKHFWCACAKCNEGLEECRPIQLSNHCQLCQQPHPIFWHAQQNSYVCVHTIDQKNTLPIQENDPMLLGFFKTETELSQAIRHLEHSLEHGILSFPAVLKELALLLTGSQWKTTIHSWHWLNVAACQFLSQAASAMARMQPQVNVALLQLSVVALLHNLSWVEQTVGLLRQSNSENNDTTKALAKIIADDEGGKATIPSQLMTMLQSSLANMVHSGKVMVSQQELKQALSLVCSATTTADENFVTADSLLTAFFIGQDLLLAEHIDLCLILYHRYQAWFHKLKQPSAENRDRVDLLLSSRGGTNPFTNIIL